MTPITDQLRSNREAILLLYLADELSPADRAEVKRLLAEDPSLQNDLEALGSLHTEVVGGLDSLDSATELKASADISVRRVVREMRKHQLVLDSRAPAQFEPSTIRAIPRWVYPIAAAAALIFIVLGLWGVGAIDFTPAMPGPSLADNNDPYAYPSYLEHSERLEDILFASFGGGEEIDHPLELEETEDPAAIAPTEASS